MCCQGQLQYHPQRCLQNWSPQTSIQSRVQAAWPRHLPLHPRCYVHLQLVLLTVYQRQQLTLQVWRRRLQGSRGGAPCHLPHWEQQQACSLAAPTGASQNVGLTHWQPHIPQHPPTQPPQCPWQELKHRGQVAAQSAAHQRGWHLMQAHQTGCRWGWAVTGRGLSGSERCGRCERTGRPRQLPMNPPPPAPDPRETMKRKDSNGCYPRHYPEDMLDTCLDNVLSNACQHTTWHSLHMRRLHVCVNVFGQATRTL